MTRRGVSTLFRAPLAVLGALALAAGLAACGSSGAEDPTTAPVAPTTEEAAPTSAASPSAIGVDETEAAPAVEQLTPAAGTTGSVTVTDDSVILGNPDAPDKATIYFDLMCPHCQVLHGVMAADVDGWIAGTDVAVEYVAVNYLGPRTTHDFSGRGANLLALVADKYPEQWKSVLDALFAMQPGTTTDVITDEDLTAAAATGGVTLTDEDLAAVTGMAYSDWVETATADAAAAGVNFIPQVWIDGALVGGETHEETAQMVRDALAN